MDLLFEVFLVDGKVCFSYLVIVRFWFFWLVKFFVIILFNDLCLGMFKVGFKCIY